MQSTGLQLRSTVKKEGTLELSLTSVPIPEPKPDEVDSEDRNFGQSHPPESNRRPTDYETCQTVFW